METFDNIVQYIKKKSTRTISDEFIQAMVLYFGAIELNRNNIRKNRGNGIINFYTQIYAKSGLGKSYTISILEKMFFTDDYNRQLNIMFDYCDELLNREKDNFLKSALPNVHISLDGSKEGLFLVATAIKESNWGSLNLLSEEFADVAIGSKELVQKLKELYDGKYARKVIKSTAEEKRYSDIVGLPTNMLATSSLDGTTRDVLLVLSSLARSGMYRRSLVVLEDKDVEKKTIEETHNPVDEITKVRDKWKDKLLLKLENAEPDDMTLLMTIGDAATKLLDDIDSELIDRANSDKLNMYFSFDIGALELIENMAYIISFVNGNDKVSMDAIKQAKEIFFTTRENSFDIFKEKKAYQEIYDILQIKKIPLTQQDLMELDRYDIIPRAKNQFKDALALAKEIAYKNAEIISETTGMVSRFELKPLQSTNLKKLIFSLHYYDENTGKGDGAKAIAYTPVEIDWDDIERMIRTEYSESFTCCHYKPSSRTEPLGHRKKDNFIDMQNVIAFDFDNNASIEEVEEKLKFYKYALYTTKSHGIKGDGDRFRVIMPCQTMFSVDPENHKQMMANIEDFLGIDNNDVSTRNVSRLFFLNKDAEYVSVNNKQDTELFDVLPFIPDTNAQNKFLKLASSIPNASDIVAKVSGDYGTNTDAPDEIRIEAMIQKSAEALHVGNLNDTLYKVYLFAKDLTNDHGSAMQAVMKLQRKTKFPMRFVEAVEKRFR